MTHFRRKLTQLQTNAPNQPLESCAKNPMRRTPCAKQTGIYFSCVRENLERHYGVAGAAASTHTMSRAPGHRAPFAVASRLSCSRSPRPPRHHHVTTTLLYIASCTRTAGFHPGGLQPSAAAAAAAATPPPAPPAAATPTAPPPPPPRRAAARASATRARTAPRQPCHNAQPCSHPTPPPPAPRPPPPPPPPRPPTITPAGPTTTTPPPPPAAASPP